jgi:glycosyltransferase involved in cell wall biosynthesis
VSAAPRIAYYYHAFPILSETFIQREVIALRQAGLAVDVLAHGTLEAEHFGEQANQLMATTTYIPAMGSQGFPASIRRCAWRHPLRVVNLFFYVVFRQHGPRKTFGRDRQLFNQAVHLAGALEAKGVTHVHCPWASPDATITMLAATLLGIRYTVQARASDIHRHTARFGRHERLTHAAFVITNTRYNESILRSLLPHRPPVHVIYNGIDVHAFHPAPRRPDVGSPPRLLYVGRLTAPKGIEFLLNACALLRDAGRAVHCEIIGGRVANEVNYYLELKKLRRNLGLDAQVDFVGAQPFDHILTRYADTDVFVLPAVMAPDGRREVIPNVLIEAMAMQVPVVSTTLGAIPEIIDDGVSGLLVPPRDAHALAAAITRVLDDAALRQSLGVNARKRVEERFDINKNVQRYVALFAGSQP